MITIDAIKTEHAKLAEMIQAFEKQAALTYQLPAATIVLQPGERYAGIIVNQPGAANYHLILLDGDQESITWTNAKEWVKKIGWALPTRREQALLYANLKEEFEGAWYWSDAQPAARPASAWCQDFDDGYQHSTSVDHELRARAVRRLTI
jgi:hypothetical protein